MNGMEASSIQIKDLADLEREATRLAGEITPRAGHATLVTLSGELGAGKTTFVQALARALGISEPVTSPTFVLAKAYSLPDGVFSRLVHIDAYRLTEDNGLATIRFRDFMQDASNLIVLEWPEMVDGELPEPDIRLSLEALASGARHLTYA